MLTLVDYQQNILPLSEILGHTFKTWHTQNILNLGEKWVPQKGSRKI